VPPCVYYQIRSPYLRRVDVGLVGEAAKGSPVGRQQRSSHLVGGERKNKREQKKEENKKLRSLCKSVYDRNERKEAHEEQQRLTFGVSLTFGDENAPAARSRATSYRGGWR
jgi:hypothetical protein